MAELPCVLLFDPTDAFCDAEFCDGFNEHFGYLYRDFDHLSESGSRMNADGLAEFLLQRR